MSSFKAARKRPVHPHAPVNQPAAAARSRRVDSESHIGNQAMLRRLCRANSQVQYKLEIGAVNDPLEAEADRVAEHVMRMPDPASLSSVSSRSVQRKCKACEEEDAKMVRPKSNGQTHAGAEAPPIVHGVLASSGQPLDTATRAFFEPRFGVDLSAVRVHTDEPAGRSAESVGAIAYSAGRDIVFAPGRYQPHSAEGRTLLAHELTHTIQQGAVPPSVLSRTPVTPRLGISNTQQVLQRSPECPYAYGVCGGQSCTHSTGGAGFCRWSGTIAKGCVCIKIENTQLVRWVETVLLAALLAIGVVITLAALVALVACLLSGACEIAAAIALVGFAGAMLIMTMIRSAPSPTLASASPEDTGPGSDSGGPPGGGDGGETASAPA